MRYELAVHDDDYLECRALMAQEGFKPQNLEYPTVMAIADDGTLVGFVSTHIEDDSVIAGPLVMDRERSRPFTAMKLMSRYEDTMRQIGIQRFIFYIDTEESGLTRGIKKYFPELVPYAIDGTKEFFVRVLD